MEWDESSFTLSLFHLPTYTLTHLQMIHFITRFDEDDEREYLAREHINRLAPSQVVPFKRVVTQMVDHFESRVNELKEEELRLAGKVLHVSIVGGSAATTAA